MQKVLGYMSVVSNSDVKDTVANENGTIIVYYFD